MTATQLPHLSELNEDQALLEIHYYDEQLDSFACTAHNAAPCEGQRFMCPALLLPMLVHEYGEPDEFVGRTILIEQSAKKADYRCLHDNMTRILEDTRDNRPVRGGVPVRADILADAAKAYDAVPTPHQL